MSRREKTFRNPPRMYVPREDSKPKHGDRVSDGNGGTYEVVGASKGRL